MAQHSHLFRQVSTHPLGIGGIAALQRQLREGRHAAPSFLVFCLSAWIAVASRLCGDCRLFLAWAMRLQLLSRLSKGNPQLDPTTQGLPNPELRQRGKTLLRVPVFYASRLVQHHCGTCDKPLTEEARRIRASFPFPPLHPSLSVSPTTLRGSSITSRPFFHSPGPSSPPLPFLFVPFFSTSHHVSRRSDSLRDRLQPRHPCSRPRLRIRTVCQPRISIALVRVLVHVFVCALALAFRPVAAPPFSVTCSSRLRLSRYGPTCVKARHIRSTSFRRRRRPPPPRRPPSDTCRTLTPSHFFSLSVTVCGKAVA